MSADRIVTTALRQIEDLRHENGWLWIALRGFEHVPVNPLPLLSGSEILSVLHPTDPYRGRHR